MTDGAGASDPDPIGHAVQHATMLADVGRPDEGLTIVEAALGEHPDAPQLQLTAAWLHLRLNQPGVALPILLGLMGSQPDDAYLAYLLSVSHAALGDLAAARTHADRALELAPDSPRNHLQVALVVTSGTIRKADRALARTRIASALELAPDQASVARTAAELEWRMGDIVAARAMAKRALAIEPDNPDLLYLDSALAGELLPGQGTQEYSSLWAIADEVGGMGGVLGSAPDHSAAGRALFSRVWAQLLRVQALPLVALALVAIGIGTGMGDGPFVQMLYTAAALAVFWPLLWLFVAWAITSRAPRGYVRGQLRGGEGASLRRAGTAIAAIVALVGVAGLLWLRDPVLVRWLLIAIAVAGVIGGVALAAWFHWYLSSAVRAGVLDSSADGITWAASFRAALARAVGLRVFWSLGAGILALMVSSMTRADAAPVLMVVMISWTAPAIHGLLRVRRIESELRDAVDEGDAPVTTKPPGIVSGALLGLLALAALAALVLALVQVPWGPSERDSHEAYQPYTGESQCTGRPASRLACIIEMQQSPTPLPSITIPDIDLPDIEIPDGIETDTEDTEP